STKINGLPLPSQCVPPRKVILGMAPGRPDPVDTRTPGMVPANACAGLDRIHVSNTLLSNVDTDAVNLFRRTVLYPITTTSSSEVSSLINTIVLPVSVVTLCLLEA